MKITYAVANDTLEASFQGKFTFSDNGAFKDILEAIRRNKLNSVTFDFSGTEFIDSAALGMLLLARDEAEKKQIGIILRGAGGQPEKMFTVSNFHKLFKVI